MFKSELRKLHRKSLLRHLVHRSSPQGPVIIIKNRKYINFSSNDYLGLAGNPDISRAAAASLDTFGFGSGASRLLAGGTVRHSELEKALSDFKGTESALVFNSGYSANIGIIPAIAAEGDIIFSDELNHASIVDGCRLSRAKTIIYRHKDVAHLRRLIKKTEAGRKIIVTDTVFSMDGDIAPLSVLSETARGNNALLFIDDAHGTGVLGHGKGALAHFGLKSAPHIVQMGTFSKALGTFGAFLAGDKDIISWIMNTARSFMFSTALPACAVSASLEALRILRDNPHFVLRLWANREKVINGLLELGCNTFDSETPIIPVKIKTIKEALRVADSLFRKGVYAPAIRPPTVRDPRIRLTVSAAHTEKHIDNLLRALKEVMA